MKVFNPLASYELAQYRRKILGSKKVNAENAHFATLANTNGSEVFNIDCNILCPLANEEDLSPEIMDILLFTLIERDQFISDQYYRAHCNDKDKQGNNTYRALKRNLFLSSDISFDGSLLTNVSMSPNDFINEVRHVIKPIKSQNRWHLHVLDVVASKWLYFDPSGDYENRESCRLVNLSIIF